MFKSIITAIALIIVSTTAHAGWSGHDCHYYEPTRSAYDTEEEYRDAVRYETDDFNDCIDEFIDDMIDTIDDQKRNVDRFINEIHDLKADYQNGELTNTWLCFKPTKPTRWLTFQTQAQVNIYNNEVNFYNNKLRSYNNCVRAAWETARRDVNIKIDVLNSRISRSKLFGKTHTMHMKML